MVEVNWPILDLHLRYEKFIHDFREFLNLVENSDDMDAAQAFQIRILLIHQFRRILLKDPNLPFELLPSNWLSLNARNLSSNLYQLVVFAGKSTLCSLLAHQKVLCHLYILCFISDLVV